MAQKINVTLVDDLTGDAADETVSFGLDGQSYEIDLSTKNAKGLRDALATYIAHARRAGTAGSRRGGARPRRGGGGGATADRQRSAEIRAWARKKGLKVSERGRIASEIVGQYEAAHGGRK